MFLYLCIFDRLLLYFSTERERERERERDDTHVTIKICIFLTTIEEQTPIIILTQKYNRQGMFGISDDEPDAKIPEDCIVIEGTLICSY